MRRPQVGLSKAAKSGGKADPMDGADDPELSRRADELGGRLSDVERELHALANRVSAERAPEISDVIASRLDESEARLEAQAVAIDEALAAEQARISEALEALAKLRRRAKEEIEDAAGLEERLRDAAGEAATGAAESALQRQIALEREQSEKELEKAAGKATARVGDRVEELSRRMDGASEAALSRVKRAADEARGHGQELATEVKKAEARISEAAEKVTRKAARRDTKLARTETEKRLERVERRLSEHGERIRGELSEREVELGDEREMLLESALAQMTQRLSGLSDDAVAALEAAQREGEEGISRVRAEAEGSVAEAVARARSEMEASLAEIARREASAGATEAIAAHLETAIGAVQDAERSARGSVAAGAEAAAERLAAVDRAQEREARVREASSRAATVAEQRVREAERRLLDVLRQIAAAEEALEDRTRGGERDRLEPGR